MPGFSILTLALLAVNTILVFCAVVIFFLVHKFGGLTPTIAKDPNYLPRVSIVIPTYNEETIIEERLENITNMDYPSHMLEVVFVDNSSDRTPEIIKEYMKSHPYIKLQKQEKPGFNAALNQGYTAATGDIVIKSDCDAFPFPDALRKIVANFADDRIGAVSGVCHFDSSDKRMEKLLRDTQTRVKQTEAYFHSSLVFLGGFGAYRRHLIPWLPEKITADDSELVINVVRKGYRAIVDPLVKVKFISPENFVERRKQLGRRAGGVVRVLFKNIRMFLNPRFGKFGLITMPMEFFIMVAAPILLLVDLLLWLMFAAAYHPAFAVALLATVGLIVISAGLSIRVRMLLDTYLSCLHGILVSFTRKKIWEKESEGRRNLLETVNS